MGERGEGRGLERARSTSRAGGGGFAGFAGICDLKSTDQGMSAAQLQDREGSSKYSAPRADLALSDFKIIRRLGDGSYSEVLHVQHVGTLLEYALKVVDKQLVLRHKVVERVRAERDILDRCAYAGIVRLKFTFQDTANLYFGLELLPNGELYQQIRCKSRLDVDTARTYAAEVVLMLEYLRHVQVVHRDLKPENLMLSADGHLKLIDFGSAMRLADDAAEPAEEGAHAERKLRGSAQATSLVGTADYVAPETLANESATYAVDLWALGCILFHMLTGQPPFKAASEYLTFQRISDGSFLVPDGMSAAGEDLVRRLLVRDPSSRLGAAGVDQLKHHKFFAGIDWDHVWCSKAPAFEPLGSEDTGQEEGLDWELSSLAAAALRF